MNQVAQRQERPIDRFKRHIQMMDQQNELALPSNVSRDAFRNAAIVAAQDNPKILSCNMESVFKSLRSLAASGLVPDGREAALVPFKTKDGDQWIDKCQAMPMVFGLVKMARRSGDVADIRAHIVYQNEIDQDRFEYVVGDEESLRHKPILFEDRGPPVAAYAIAKLKDGTIVREFMSASDIDVVRRAGSSQKLFRKGQKPSISDEPIGIWHDWWAEMWKKTVIRRICKRLDLSAEDMRHIQAEPDHQIREINPEQDAAEPRPNAAKKLMGTSTPAETTAEAAPEAADGESGDDHTADHGDNADAPATDDPGAVYAEIASHLQNGAGASATASMYADQIAALADEAPEWHDLVLREINEAEEAEAQGQVEPAQ